MGFGEDVYLLTLVGAKKRQELIANLDPLPGHRSKLEDLFLKIETVSLIVNLVLFRCTRHTLYRKH